MRYTLTEFATKKVFARFTTGNTVTITVYDRTNNHTEVLTSNSCTEIGTTGIFEWSFADLKTQPVAWCQFVWVMDNGTSTYPGFVEAGGWPDDVANATDIAASVWAKTLNTQDSTTYGGVFVWLHNMILNLYNWTLQKLRFR